MQNADLFNNMPDTLAAKVQAYAGQTATKARNICTRYGVLPAVCGVFILDATDILRAKYCGLRATIEQMRALTDAVPLRCWDKTENAALCFIARYYAAIAENPTGTQTLGVDFLNAVVVCEVVKRAAPDCPIVCDEAEQQREAQRLYYTYAVLIAGEWCNATEDELRGIQPNGITIEDDKVQRLIVSALNMQAQRQQVQQKQQTKRNPQRTMQQLRESFAARAAGLPFEQTKTIRQYQNFAYMIGSGIQTADALSEDGRGGKMRPLWQGIAEQQQAANALISDRNANEDDKQRAAQFLTTTYAVTQVLDSLQILPQVMPPDSGTTTRMIWDMTTYQYARVILGIENPTATQVTALLRATAWLSTQRTAVVETSTKYKTRRDSSGAIVKDETGKPKRDKVQKDIVTEFQPVVVEFRTEYENKVLIEKATRIRIEVHRLFADGRSAEYAQDGNTRDYITKPQQQYLTIEQYYDFTTENERLFRNIILSKPQQAEDTLLSAVFNYPKRQAQLDAAAAEAAATARQARAAAEVIEHTPAIPARQKTEAQQQAAEAEAAAERAAKRAKYHITTHMGDDVKKLKAMYEKALRNGLITAYYDTGRTGSNGQQRYGRGVVWHWQRGNGKQKTKAVAGSAAA